MHPSTFKETVAIDLVCVQRVFWILIDVLMFLLVITLVVDILCHRLLATYIDI